VEGGRGRLKSCERRNMVPKERRKTTKNGISGRAQQPRGARRSAAGKMEPSAPQVGRSHQFSRRELRLGAPGPALGSLRRPFAPPKGRKMSRGAHLRALLVAPPTPSQTHTHPDTRWGSSGAP